MNSFKSLVRRHLEYASIQHGPQSSKRQYPETGYQACKKCIAPAIRRDISKFLNTGERECRCNTSLQDLAERLKSLYICVCARACARMNVVCMHMRACVCVCRLGLPAC